MKHSVIGMDIAKKVFQLHTVDQCTGRIERIKLRRDEVLAFFANYPTSLVAIEACGSALWWARQLQQQGHEVLQLAPIEAKYPNNVTCTDTTPAPSHTNPPQISP